MKYFYGLLCILGFLLPYWAFMPWLLENGPDLPRLLTEAFSGEISAFAWLDVVVSAVVLTGFIFAEGQRLGMKFLWLPILSVFTVGVSLGLPLFLLLRELHVEKTSKTGAVSGKNVARI
ncbi:DUF2834 domain-containing protein [Pseudovibrio sp. JE062]|uniref:DUF2834 domain-containing protein n=1 Tax=Pseudovibrio sp. JE062 TaxID=439495 RepID=UPI000186B8BA|nr:DUF2834 domain-containing protein [Pseudovibrio sp. JE062]EEA92046.1 conserved hypothetical protein [Pseudovibrio sp. JE062]